MLTVCYFAVSPKEDDGYVFGVGETAEAALADAVRRVNAAAVECGDEPDSEAGDFLAVRVSGTEQAVRSLLRCGATDIDLP